jgi:hypothetical protein
LCLYRYSLLSSSLVAFFEAMAQTSISCIELVGEETAQPREEKEKYCSECRDKILPWKKDLYVESTNTGMSFGNLEYKQSLHKDLLDFIECAKWCRLCGYLCSLVDEQYLEEKISRCTSGTNTFVEIGFDPYQSRCDSFGTFEVVQMRIILRSTMEDNFQVYWEHHSFEFNMAERRANMCTAAGAFY